VTVFDGMRVNCGAAFKAPHQAEQVVEVSW
jgi:hypothetical protein